MKRPVIWPALLLLALGLGLLAVPGVRFSAYLCFLGAGLWGIWLALRQLSEKYGFFRICKVIFLVGLTAAFLLLAAAETAIVSYGKEHESADPPDAVLILGAGVNGENPSLALHTRISRAAEYLEQYPEIPVVLSGGQGPGENITEAECMRRYLTARGIAPERLLLEDRSTSTAENFAFSRQVLAESGIAPETAVIGVVTNSFHAYRASLLAKQNGMSTVSVPAELPWWLDFNYYLREPFALIKTLIFD